MIKVTYITHPLNKENKAIELEIALNKIVKHGGTILYITSDNDGYTVVYNKFV